VQAYGIGSLRANTILLNWLGNSSKKILGLGDGEFSRNIRSAYLYGCNVVILDVKADKWEAIKETEVRIEADPEIVRDVDADTIAEYSADAALAFIPFRIKNNQIVDPFGNPMEKTLFLLPVTAMVLAAEDIELDAKPDQGKAGEMAEAIDALDDARKKARTAVKEAQKATAAA
jgi:hypothetical protein